MNKQEAIEKVKEHGEFYSNAFGGTVAPKKKRRNTHNSGG